jgi:hypothetical protein
MLFLLWNFGGQAAEFLLGLIDLALNFRALE